jgi:pimeloyl-ACP methyl ester carboxylesterase
MGVGIAKRSLIFRIGAGAIKGALALVLFILVLLVILRLMAAVRENGAEVPPETVRFQTPKGVVAAHLSGPADGRPIMLIHGTAAWSGFWREVADHLAGRGWRVIAIDLPPFGWSGHDAEGRYDRATQAERLAAVLRKQSKKAVVVGHSFGAGAATELALRHPDELQGLVLVDAALGKFNAEGQGTTAKALGFRPLAEIVASAAVTNPAALEPLLRSMIARKEQASAWVPVLREPMQREGTTTAYAAWLPNLFSKNDGSLSRRGENLRNIAVPVSLIWGEADTVTPIEQGRHIAELTRARSLKLLPGVGHIPHIEDPEAFLAALDGALADVEKGGR